MAVVPLLGSLCIAAVLAAAASANLVIEIGLYTSDNGAAQPLSDGDTITRMSGSGDPVSLYCRSTTAWEQCVWLWGDRKCVYYEAEGDDPPYNTCENEVSRVDNKCNVVTTEEVAGEWNCMLFLFDIDIGGNDTDEAQITMEEVLVADVLVNNTDVPLTLLVGESVVLGCVSSEAFPEATLDFVLDGVVVGESNGTGTNRVAR
jgi:hypothetical protein